MLPFFYVLKLFFFLLSPQRPHCHHSIVVHPSACRSDRTEAMALKDRVEAVLNVGLRVPSIMLLDVLYRWDVSSFFQKIQRSSLSNNPLFQYKYLALYLHYVG